MLYFHGGKLFWFPSKKQNLWPILQLWRIFGKALLRVRDEKVVKNVCFIFTVVNFFGFHERSNIFDLFCNSELSVNSLPKKQKQSVCSNNSPNGFCFDWTQPSLKPTLNQSSVAFLSEAFPYPALNCLAPSSSTSPVLLTVLLVRSWGFCPSKPV